MPRARAALPGSCSERINDGGAARGRRGRSRAGHKPAHRQACCPESRYTRGMAEILVDVQGPIARLTLNRPDKRNPIGPATCGELVHALAQIKANATLRVVVLTGAGPVFSAGGGPRAVQGAPGGTPPATPVEPLGTKHAPRTT